METPTIYSLILMYDAAPNSLLSIVGNGFTCGDGAKELRAVKAKAAQVPPVRKLREVETVWSDRSVSGCVVRYDNGYQFVLSSGGVSATYDTLADLVMNRSGCLWTDEILSQCLALKGDPYEPVETVEDVLHAVAEELKGTSQRYWFQTFEAFAPRLRAAVHAETPGAA